MKDFLMSWALGVLIGFLVVIIIFLLVTFSYIVYLSFGLWVVLIMLIVILGAAIAVGIGGF